MAGESQFTVIEGQGWQRRRQHLWPSQPPSNGRHQVFDQRRTWRTDAWSHNGRGTGGLTGAPVAPEGRGSDRGVCGFKYWNLKESSSTGLVLNPVI